MSAINQQIKNESAKLFQELVEIRRHLHANPELSFEEYNTSHYIQHILDSHQIAFSTGWVKTGIVANIEGKNPSSRIIALRADMDALPILEKNEIPYASRNPGVMHACGHDVHSSCMIGAAIVLNSIKDEFDGTIRIIFQPAEEKLPGGAHLMIQDGVLKNPDVEMIIGQHVFPELEVGKVGFREGMYMASTDEIHLTIEGRGGHAALPHQYDYSTIAAAEFMLNCQNNHENLKKKTSYAVLAFGKIIAEGATNVIPEKVKIEGTLRTLNEEHRNAVHAMLEEEAKRMEAKYKSAFHLDIKKGYPVLYNNEALTQKCKELAETYLGKENVVDLDIRMTAEDFAFYSREIPACFFRLGTGNQAKGITSPVHTPTFDIDESALEIGSGLMAAMAIHILSKNQ